MYYATIDEAPEEIVAEVVREVNSFLRFVDSIRKDEVNEADALEKIENRGIEAVRKIGNILARGGISLLGTGRAGAPKRCKCGGKMRDKGDRRRTIMTLLGDVKFSRAYYRCKGCGRSLMPLDRKLGIGRDSLSGGVKRALSLMGSQVPFKRAALVLKDLAGIHISVSSVNKRCVDIGSKLSASAPVRQVAAEDVKRAEISTDSCCVNTTDGWKEIKTATIGAKDLQTRYIAAIQAAEKFGLRMRKEFLSSAARKAGEVVVVADGAKWIWNQVGINFPFRTHEIVDYWHAAQQIWTCARARWGEGDRERRWAKRYSDLLWDAGGREVLKRLKCSRPRTESGCEAVRQLIGYISNNLSRMEYPRFRELGLNTSSGVIESACKQVVITRLRGAGMRWSKRGAQSIVALRALWLSDNWHNIDQILKDAS